MNDDWRDAEWIWANTNIGRTILHHFNPGTEYEKWESPAEQCFYETWVVAGWNPVAITEDD